MVDVILITFSAADAKLEKVCICSRNEDFTVFLFNLFQLVVTRSISANKTTWYTDQSTSKSSPKLLVPNYSFQSGYCYKKPTG